MILSLSTRSADIEQAEIRAMFIECAKAGGINLAQGVPGEAFFYNGNGKDLLRFCFAKRGRELREACNRLEGLASMPRLSFASLPAT